jgi:hypothetical protein
VEGLLSLRVRLVLAALVAPYALALPLSIAEPYLFGAHAKAPGLATLTALVVALASGAAWPVGIAAARPGASLRAAVWALATAWGAFAAWGIARLVLGGQLGGGLDWLGAATLPGPVVAASLVLLAAVAHASRPAATGAAAAVVVVQGVQLAGTALFQSLAWGRWWIWSSRSGVLVVLNAALALAVVAALIRVWLDRRDGV